MAYDERMGYTLLLMLWAGHYIADYPFQSAYMAENKAYALMTAEGTHALTAHAFIQGLTAGVISHSVVAALCVGLSHWLIDFGKASKLLKRGKRSGLYGINVDQALHLSVIFLVWLWLL